MTIKVDFFAKLFFKYVTHPTFNGQGEDRIVVYVNSC